jgi:transcriptional regulator with XRE-family HTH domain
MKVLDAAGKVTVEAVERPKLYVRGRFRMDYAQQLADVARDAMLNTDGKTLNMGGWPFTDPKRPILIRRVVSEKKDAKSGKITQEEHLFALDGNHRVEAGRILKLIHVPARIVECSDKEAALAQLQANVDQGLFLDRKARNEYILALLTDKEMKISQKEVAGITHLTPASINRILKGTQGRRSEASKKAGKAAKKAKRGARVDTTFSTRTWFAELVSVSGDFDKKSDVIEAAAKGKTFKVSEEFKEFIAGIKASE